MPSPSETPAAQYELLSPERERWSTPRGELVVWQPQQSVVVFQVSGHISQPIAKPVMERVQQLLDAGLHPTVFDDLERAVSYDGVVRLEVTRFAVRTAPRVAATHVLVRSKLIAMTVAVANLALRQHLTVHSARNGFDAALDRALAAARPRAPA